MATPKGVLIGFKNLVYAEVLTDEGESAPGAGDGYTSYDAPKAFPGAITGTYSPGTANDTLFADDGAYEVAVSAGSPTLELNVAELKPETYAFLLGAKYDSTTGAVIDSGADVPPYVAIGFSMQKSSGSNAARIVWLLKGRFSKPDISGQTKADSTNWNTPTIQGSFVSRASDQRTVIQVDSDNSDALAKWGTQSGVINGVLASPNLDIATQVAAPVATPLPSVGDLSVSSTNAITLASATAGATIEYKLSTEAAWTTGTSVATAAWPVTNPATVVVLNTRASKTGESAATANFAYRVVT